MTINIDEGDLSESFLHFLDCRNTNNKTFCEEKTNIYHDSSYLWCKVCNKILCSHCSMAHLLNNQIDHSVNKIFLNKEHLDCELRNEFSKLEVLQKLSDDFFSKNNQLFIEKHIKSLNEILKRFEEFKNDFINLLENFKNKVICSTIENINIYIKNYNSNNLNENIIKKNITNLSIKYKNIENKYSKSQEFMPNKIKPYHDELSEAYKCFISLNNEIKCLDNSKSSFIKEIDQKCENVKIISNNAINNIKNYTLSFNNFLQDIKY